MYRQRLKQKTLLLVVLFGFLIFLIMPGTRKESEQDLPEEGERLEIPKEEEEEGRKMRSRRQPAGKRAGFC